MWIYHSNLRFLLKPEKTLIEFSNQCCRLILSKSWWLQHRNYSYGSPWIKKGTFDLHLMNLPIWWSNNRQNHLNWAHPLATEERVLVLSMPAFLLSNPLSNKLSFLFLNMCINTILGLVDSFTTNNILGWGDQFLRFLPDSGRHTQQNGCLACRAGYSLARYK